MGSWLARLKSPVACLQAFACLVSMTQCGCYHLACWTQVYQHQMGEQTLYVRRRAFACQHVFGVFPIGESVSSSVPSLTTHLLDAFFIVAKTFLVLTPQVGLCCKSGFGPLPFHRYPTPIRVHTTTFFALHVKPRDLHVRGNLLALSGLYFGQRGVR